MPAEVIYFNAAAQGASSAPRLSRGFFSEGAPAPCTELPKREAQKLSPPGRAALIRHGAAQRRTVPPSPRGRLSAPAPCTKLPKCEAQKLSPPGRAALIRHGAAQRRTVPPSPKGKAKRSRAVHKISTVNTGKPRLAPSVLQYVFLHKNNRLILA